MLASITHYLPLTTIIRRRMLPADGRILVKIGQKVTDLDIIAETMVDHQHLILDVAEGLHVSPRRAGALIKIKRGQKVKQNDVVAKTTGIFAREVIAPDDGRVVAVGSGKIVLETGGMQLDLQAGMTGIVKEIIGNRGVVIRAFGGVVQGVWGNGKIDSGILMSVMDHPDDNFDVKRLDVSIRNSIILGGYIEDPTILQDAVELPVRGLILSSIAPELMSIALKLPFPIMLIEGFGRRPMNIKAYNILNTHIRRNITLNGNVFDPQEGDRPEVFISVPIFQEPPPATEIDTYTSGQSVRVISLFKPSQIGTIKTVNQFPTVLPNGLRTRTAGVELESGEHIMVPLTNLDLLI